MLAGAIFLTQRSSLHLSGSWIRNNTAADGDRTSEGGGLYVDTANLTVASTIFEANVAAGRGHRGSWGGAIFVSGAAGNLALGLNVSFVNNTAINAASNGFGGAIAVDSGGRLEALHGTLFMDNRVEGSDAYGGALYSQNSVVHIQEAVFDGNQLDAISGTGHGAGLAIASGEMACTGCQVRGNVCSMSGSGLDASGGGIYVGETAAVVLIETYLSSNLAGGRGIFEAVSTYAEVAQENKDHRASEVFVTGLATLERCIFDSSRTRLLLGAALLAGVWLGPRL